MAETEIAAKAQGEITIRPLAGADLRAALPDLADLRIRIFRDWPYLYAGDAAYEASYLSHYAESRGALIIGAFAGQHLVGAATAAPAEDHAPEFAQAYRRLDLQPEQICYFGESLLLPEWRGRGLYARFFEGREAHARALGRDIASFCAVIRPPDHPLKPEGYQPLDPVWRRRGYEPMTGLVAEFSWTDLRQAEPTAKPMQGWVRRLPG